MRHKVLIIDDDPSINELVRHRLKDENVEIFSASGGDEGLAIAFARLPDVILLDVDMPAPDGFEVCRRLKSRLETRDIPVIFLTGSEAIAQKAAGLEVGAVDYITKPFDASELRARVRASLRNKQLLDLLAEKAAILRMSEEKFRFLAENATDIISTLDLDGRFRYASRAAEDVLGYRPEELVGHLLTEFVQADSTVNVASALAALACSEESAVLTFAVSHRSGRSVWLESTCRAVRNAQTDLFVELHVSSRDVTARKNAEVLERGRAQILELVASNQPLPLVLERLVEMAEQQYPGAVGSAVLLSDGRLEHFGLRLSEPFHQAMRSHLLRTTLSLCSGNAGKVGQDVLVTDMTTDDRWETVREQVTQLGLRTCWSIPICSGTGETLGMFAIHHRSQITPDAAAREMLETVARLITIASEHRELTHQLAHRAHHDSLTGLPNRLLFHDRLTQALARAARCSHVVALCYFDLDRFKLINDTLGHHAGDLLLEQLSKRVQAGLRQTDTLARMGGDEFAIILPELRSPADAAEVAVKILELLRSPFPLLGQEIFVTGSIGIAIYPEDGTDGPTLQRNADVAMYRAKATGRNYCQRFRPEMANIAPEHFAIEAMLRSAIAHNELELDYQPQFDPCGQLLGLEALVRWRHPTFGLMSPAKFIPLAEETGLIIEIGKWVLNEACRQNKAWQAAGLPPVRVAVNVSVMQFARADFVDVISSVLKEQQIEARWLELEITETLLMRSHGETAEKLSRIRLMGVTIALDDFGTGYSSLAYLQKLPIDTLKIDKSFVKELEKNSDSGAAVVRAILSLGHGLGMRVVAEGVETECQTAFLRRAGCDGMQGYHLGRPMSPTAVRALLSSAQVPASLIA